ncbi:MAG: hypothetical protein ABIO44_03270 [Saprospiraceae bacterium]
MKVFFATLFGLFCLTSCVKQEVGDFKLQYNKVFTISAGSSTTFINVVDFYQRTGWDNFLSGNALKSTDISRVTVASISVAPLLANEISYRFIEEIKVFILNPVDPKSKLQIGSAYPQPNERISNLFLLPGIADIKDYISLDEVRFQIEIRYRELITSNSDHNLELQFNVFKN